MNAIDKEIKERYEFPEYCTSDLADQIQAKRNAFKCGFLFAQRWISVEEALPKHLELCLFRMGNGNICIGKCKYFEHGDSELIEVYGKGLSYLCHSYRNWELHDFKWEKKFTVTHWLHIPFSSEP